MNEMKYVVTKSDGLIYVSTPEDPSYDAIFGPMKEMVLSRLIYKYCGWQEQAYWFDKVYFDRLEQSYLVINCKAHLTIKQRLMDGAFWISDRNHCRD